MPGTHFDDNCLGDPMPRRNLTAALCLLCMSTTALGAEAPIAFVIHGGAGVVEREKMTPEREASYRAGLTAAVDAGYAVLERGGSALDAVATAVRIMEDDPQFNAGRGAALDQNGDAELDAAIMDGRGPRAGGVAAVEHVRNPVDLARLVMERSPHVLLVGSGAEEFALEQGVVLVPRSYFRTRARIAELAEEKQAAEDKTGVPANNPKGTVGAVALDRAGNLAAATSTGGLSNKHAGRVGDSPLIGAGTYANNQSCAVSGTGDGEYFMRQVVAYDICAMVAYRHLTLEQAVTEVVHEKLRATGGTGGVIAIDPAGNIVMDFNTVGMFRAARDSRGRREIAVYRDK